MISEEAMLENEKWSVKGNFSIVTHNEINPNIRRKISYLNKDPSSPIKKISLYGLNNGEIYIAFKISKFNHLDKLLLLDCPSLSMHWSDRNSRFFSRKSYPQEWLTVQGITQENKDVFLDSLYVRVPNFEFTAIPSHFDHLDEQYSLSSDSQEYDSEEYDSKKKTI